MSSIRDSVTSSNRFSSLLNPSASSSRTSLTSTSFPIPNSSPLQPLQSSSSSSLPIVTTSTKRTTIIYDRALSKTRGSEISLGAWAFLFSEIIQYTQKRVSGIGEFEKRLVIPLTFHS